MPISPEAARDYLEALVARRAEAEQKGQIDNSSLHAGSPMYYYCRVCRLITEVLPETHVKSPKRHCDACQEMIDKGYSPSLDKFPGVETAPIRVIVDATAVETTPDSRQLPSASRQLK